MTAGLFLGAVVLIAVSRMFTGRRVRAWRVSGGALRPWAAGIWPTKVQLTSPVLQAMWSSGFSWLDHHVRRHPLAKKQDSTSVKLG